MVAELKESILFLFLKLYFSSSDFFYMEELNRKRVSVCVKLVVTGRFLSRNIQVIVKMTMSLFNIHT